MAEIINGKLIAEQIREEIREKVEAIKIKPGLAVVLVGADPASQVYVRNKELACNKAGFYSMVYRMEKDTTEEELLTLIEKLNDDDSIHGILVQLPLPKHLDESVVIRTIKPEKDVDGFHSLNMGNLVSGEKSLVPCTPKGIIELIKSTGIDIAGKNAVIVGRSNIVGKPVALLLLREHATVTICHSKTIDLPKITREADILVAAIGSPGFITEDMVKDGAVVIDVGINRVNDKLMGDVAYEGVKTRAGWITPVPGGVGPMTIAMLLENTLEAATLNEK